MEIKKDRRRGVTLVLAALCLLALVPMLGLAVDGANVYMMRNQVATALNAAVLAGARSLTVGQDINSQAASAESVATTAFNANISGMTTQLAAPQAVFGVSQNNTTHVRTVTGTATAELPLMLMSMIGETSTPISVTATAQRRDVNVVLVLDQSGPMLGAPLAALQADANTFVSMFANSRDNVGLVAFAGAPYVAATLPNPNFANTLPATINSLQAVGSATNTAAAMWAAYQQLLSLNQPGALNVILLFTDGLPLAFTGNFAGFVEIPGFCNPSTSPLNGVLFANAAVASRSIAGLADYVAQSLNDAPDSRGAVSCPTPPSVIPQRFLSQMPSTDINGNSTNGTGSIGAYAPVTLTSINRPTITAASENAVDDAANKIRSDGNLLPVIFTIGLTNDVAAIPPDPVLMSRIANDPSSASYNSSQPAGQYISAPTTAQLQTAFVTIASQVLHLAQ